MIITVRAGNHLCSVKMAVPTRRVIHSDDSLVLYNNNHQEVQMTSVKTTKPAPAPAVISKPKISLQQVGDLQ